MSYIDGFVCAVSSDKREAYRAYAEKAAAFFKENGATQIMECWGDEVPGGKLTSFPMAVKLQDGETVVFSWIVWPSKAAREAAHGKMMTDPRFDPSANAWPFDGKRMIYGGFVPILET